MDACRLRNEKWLCAPRPGLGIHRIGPDSDLIDTDGHFRNAYALEPGASLLVRPNGHIGAFTGAGEIGARAIVNIKLA